MTRNQRYNFKIYKNQHKRIVDPFWEDGEETGAIDFFEACCLFLKRLEKSTYAMIELGSNWSYYSLLFKHILGKEKTLNIMVEPHEESFKLSLEHFKLNNCDGIFYNKGITASTLNKDFVTLHEILKLNNLFNIDILHCDIDGSEMELIRNDFAFFERGVARYIFLFTHSNDINNQCKEFFKSFPYKLVHEFPNGSQGGDGLLIFKLKFKY
jgi:hypothetical protein